MAKKRKVHPERLWLVVEKDIGSREHYIPVLVPGTDEKKIRRDRRKKGKWVKHVRPLLSDVNGDVQLHSLEKHLLAIWETLSINTLMHRIAEEVSFETRRSVNEEHALLRHRRYLERKRERLKKSRSRKKNK